LYVLRNIERGFDTVNHLEAYIFPETSETSMTSVPTPTQWRSMLSGLDLQTLPSASYIFLRRIIHALDGEKLTKNVTSLSSVALSIDLDTGSISNIVNPSSLLVLSDFKTVDVPKAEIEVLVTFRQMGKLQASYCRYMPSTLSSYPSREMSSVEVDPPNTVTSLYSN
jgi:hypothetical protein